MKKYILIIPIGFLLFGLLLSSFQDTNNHKVASDYLNGSQKGIVIIKPKQAHFVVVSSYEKAMFYINKNYVLEDVDITRTINHRGVARTIKYYTLIKYAK